MRKGKTVSERLGGCNWISAHKDFIPIYFSAEFQKAIEALFAEDMSVPPAPQSVRSNNLFISWSGPLGDGIAREIKKFFETFFPDLDVFVSSLSILKGDLWDQALHYRLRQDSFGILIITPEALHSPWLIFEAGALSSKTNCCVIPLLFDVSCENLPPPIRRHQHVNYTEDDILHLWHRVGSKHVGGDQFKKSPSFDSPNLPLNFHEARERMVTEIERIQADQKKAKRGTPREQLRWGEYSVYFLRVHQPKDRSDTIGVHRGLLTLDTDCSGRIATFKGHFKHYHYRGTWDLDAHFLTINMLDDENDRMILTLQWRENWMWGLVCGLSRDNFLFAGKIFLCRREDCAPYPPAFITADKCNEETSDPNLDQDIYEFLLESGPSVVCSKSPLVNGF